jgi:hypothetical protein
MVLGLTREIITGGGNCGKADLTSDRLCGIMRLTKAVTEKKYSGERRQGHEVMD